MRWWGGKETCRIEAADSLCIKSGAFGGNGKEKTLEKHYKELIGHAEKISYGHKIMRVVKLQCSTISKVIWNMVV